MTSAHITDLLSEYIDGSLGEQGVEKVKSHLIFCNACRDHLNDLTHNSQLLKQVSLSTPPPGLQARIVSAMKEAAVTAQGSQSTPSPLPGWIFSFKGLGLVATAVLAMVAIWNIPVNESPTMVQTPPQKEQIQDIKLEPTKTEIVPNNKEQSPQKSTKSRFSPFFNKQAENSSRNSFVPSQSRQKGSIPVSVGETNLAPSVQRELAKKSDRFIGLQGHQSGVSEPRTVVIKNEKQWSALWAEHASYLSPLPDRPFVDFNKYDIVAIFEGNRPSGGYAVQISKIEETVWNGDQARIVRFQSVLPDPQSMKTMAITQPFSLRTTSKIQGKTFFQKIP